MAKRSVKTVQVVRPGRRMRDGRVVVALGVGEGEDGDVSIRWKSVSRWVSK